MPGSLTSHIVRHRPSSIIHHPSDIERCDERNEWVEWINQLHLRCTACTVATVLRYIRYIRLDVLQYSQITVQYAWYSMERALSVALYKKKRRLFLHFFRRNVDTIAELASKIPPPTSPRKQLEKNKNSSLHPGSLLAVHSLNIPLFFPSPFRLTVFHKNGSDANAI